MGKTLAAMVLALLAPGTILRAQQEGPRYTGLEAEAVNGITLACARSAEDCGIALGAVLETLEVQGVAGAELNSALASLAGAVNAAAQRSARAPELAEVLVSLAALSTDAAQRGNILRVAEIIASGGPAPLAEQPYAASPG